MKKFFLSLTLAAVTVSIVGCKGAVITNRPLDPIVSEKSILDYSCNVILKREQSPNTITDANVLAESLAYHLVQANIFKKVGLMMNNPDVTLIAVIRSASQPGGSFGSFPVKLSIEYQVKDKNLNWNEMITTDTDSKLACGAMFAGVQRAAHDDHLAYSKNFSLAIKSLSQYIKTLK